MYKTIVMKQNIVIIILRQNMIIMIIKQNIIMIVIKLVMAHCIYFFY